MKACRAVLAAHQAPDLWLPTHQVHLALLLSLSLYIYNIYIYIYIHTYICVFLFRALSLSRSRSLPLRCTFLSPSPQPRDLQVIRPRHLWFLLSPYLLTGTAALGSHGSVSVPRFFFRIGSLLGRLLACSSFLHMLVRLGLVWIGRSAVLLFPATLLLSRQ